MLDIYNIAYHARLDDTPKGYKIWSKSEHMAKSHNTSGLMSHFKYITALSLCLTHWLFQQQMITGLHYLQSRFIVKMIRSRDYSGIAEFRHRIKVFKTLEKMRLRDIVFLAISDESLDIIVNNTRNLHCLGIFLRITGIYASPVAYTYYNHAYSTVNISLERFNRKSIIQIARGVFL